jgi:hypothetical protein
VSRSVVAFWSTAEGIDTLLASELAAGVATSERNELNELVELVTSLTSYVTKSRLNGESLRLMYCTSEYAVPLRCPPVFRRMLSIEFSTLGE